MLLFFGFLYESHHKINHLLLLLTLLYTNSVSGSRGVRIRSQNLLPPAVPPPKTPKPNFFTQLYKFWVGELNSK